MHIFTIGYEGATVAEFLAALQQAGIQRVIDVRALPLSRRPGFSKTPLSGALAEAGIEYVHLKALGTPAEGRAAARAGRHADLERIYAGQLELAEAIAQSAQMLALAERLRAPCCASSAIRPSATGRCCLTPSRRTSRSRICLREFGRRNCARIGRFPGRNDNKRERINEETGDHARRCGAACGVRNQSAATADGPGRGGRSEQPAVRSRLPRPGGKRRPVRNPVEPDGAADVDQSVRCAISRT